MSILIPSFQPILCEILYALLEYTKSVMFLWMLIEGLYLHNQIAVSVFSKKPNYTIFYAMGWGECIFDTSFRLHYDNTPLQYTATFNGCKNGSFQMKKCDIFLIFAQT